jgi:hypothetical protein
MHRIVPVRVGITPSKAVDSRVKSLLQSDHYHANSFRVY